MSTPDSILRALGIIPLTWDEVLKQVELKLSPPEAQTFARLHRAFAAYPTEHTVRAFYDFASQRDLLGLLAGYRFERLEKMLTYLDKLGKSGAEFFAGLRMLDYGAGGGALATALRDRGADVTVADVSSATVRRLEARGFAALNANEAARFDLILCADSLGEIHADEDEWLADPLNAVDPDYPREVEARYGFAQKLAGLSAYLAPEASVLIFEPIPLAHFWQGAARSLEAAGWTAEVIGPDPLWGLRVSPKND